MNATYLPKQETVTARDRTQALIGQLLEQFELGWQYAAGWSPELEPTATEAEWLHGIDRQLGTVLRAIQMRQFEAETQSRVARRAKKKNLLNQLDEKK